MAASKKPAQAKMSKTKTTSPSRIPEGLWQESPRDGIYKLYPGKSVDIPEIGSVKNNGREVIRLVSGEELPKELS